MNGLLYLDGVGHESTILDLDCEFLIEYVYPFDELLWKLKVSQASEYTLHFTAIKGLQKIETKNHCRNVFSFTVTHQIKYASDVYCNSYNNNTIISYANFENRYHV